MEVRIGTSADVEWSLQVNTFTSSGWSCWAAAPILDAQTLSHSRLPKQSLLTVEVCGTLRMLARAKHRTHCPCGSDHGHHCPRQLCPLEAIMPPLHTAGALLVNHSFCPLLQKLILFSVLQIYLVLKASSF